MLKRFISYYKPHRKLFALDMLASLIISIIGMCYPIVTRLVFKTYVPENNVKMIVICGVALFLLYFVNMLFQEKCKFHKNRNCIYLFYDYISCTRESDP